MFKNLHEIFLNVPEASLQHYFLKSNKKFHFPGFEYLRKMSKQKKNDFISIDFLLFFQKKINSAIEFQSSGCFHYKTFHRRNAIFTLAMLFWQKCQRQRPSMFLPWPPWVM
jgi:hypothetical protein